MPKRSNKITEVSGVKIFSKEQKVTETGKHAGKKFWELLITCETHPEIKRVCVFSDCVGTAGEIGAEKIMNDVEKADYADKRYLFYIYKRGTKWDLAGWKELERKN